MRRITLIMENSEGLIAAISLLLGQAGINIEGLEAEGMGATAVIHLMVDRYDEAMQVLREANYQAIAEDAMVIRVPDKPGALANVAMRFKEAHVDIRSLRIIRRENDYCLVSLVADISPKTLELVQDVLVSEPSLAG